MRTFVTLAAVLALLVTVSGCREKPVRPQDPYYPESVARGTAAGDDPPAAAEGDEAGGEASGLAAKEAPPSSDKEEAAISAALSWLEMVDAGKYDESWDSAAAYMKGAVDKETLGRSLGGAREPLGAVKERKVASSTYTTTAPGAPDGEYVIIEFETSFENKKQAVETVTPMMDGGTWRVSGYYIR